MLIRSTNISRAVVAASIAASTLLISMPTLASNNIEVESSAIRTAQQTNRLYHEVAGHYRMEDGSILKIVKVGKQVYAEIADGERIEVKARGPNKFVAVSGDTEFRFDYVDAGRVVMSIARPSKQVAVKAASSNAPL